MSDARGKGQRLTGQRALEEVERVCRTLRDSGTTGPELRAAVETVELMACTDYIPPLERHVLHASGGVLLLLGAMRENPADAALQRSACAAIEALSRQSGVPAGLPLIREVTGRVVTLLRALPGDAFTVAAALSLEHYLLREAEEGWSDGESSSDDGESGSDAGEAGAAREPPQRGGDDGGDARTETSGRSTDDGAEREAAERAPRGFKRLSLPAHHPARWSAGSGGLAGDAAQSDTDESEGEVGCSGLCLTERIVVVPRHARSDSGVDDLDERLLDIAPPDDPCDSACFPGRVRTLQLELESDRTKRAVLAEGIVRPLCHAMELCRGNSEVQQQGCLILARLAEHLGSASKPSADPRAPGAARPRRSTDSGVGPGGPAGAGPGAGLKGGGGSDGGGGGAGSCTDSLGGFCGDGGAVDEEQAEEEIRRLRVLEAEALLIRGAVTEALTHAEKPPAGLVAAGLAALAALGRSRFEAVRGALKHPLVPGLVLRAAGQLGASAQARHDAAAVLSRLAAGPPDLATGHSALHVAVLLGMPLVVRSLLEAGADPAAQDRGGATAEQLAERTGQAECAQEFQWAADHRATLSAESAVRELAGRQPAVSSHCVMCGAASATVVMLPCAHQCLCAADAARLRTDQRIGKRRCPLCKTPVERTLTVDVRGETFGKHLRDIAARRASAPDVGAIVPVAVR